MPIQTVSRGINVPMPSFMSVFGEEANNGMTGHPAESHTKHGDAIKQGHNFHHGATNSPPPFTAFHQHRDSTSTSASESADSSPTTTVSTADSASMTEPSPGPSPESPAMKPSPSSFVPDLRSRNPVSSNGDGPFFELARPVTPAKKPRNLKSLAINIAALPPPRPSTSSSVPINTNRASTTSAPASPSFVKPPTPPRRKPAALGLSLQTPGNAALPTRLAIPATPSLKKPPMLRHFQSSPQLPMMSPSVAPDGGMQLPPLRPFKPVPHGFTEVPMEYEEEEQEPNFDIPQSREEKPESYPNGPICIYESGVFLYYEPTAEQASNYDVIFNVASEVKNPFSMTIDEASEASRMDVDEKKSHSEPASTVDTVPADFSMPAFSGISGKLEESSEKSNTPTTPKAAQQDNLLRPTETLTRPVTSNRPEYIHIPWEHNTDIVPDLHKLVKVIDDRVQRKKRVLVHCQCGVSRSASLIVAYGLYKNPGITVQQAYDAVKKRSKWIGPNMNLIMQLQEFRNGLLRANGERSFHQQIYGAPSARNMSIGFGKHSPYPTDLASGSRTPQTAPLPPETSMDAASQRASTGNMETMSAIPLTAPTDPWAPAFRRSWGPTPSDFGASRHISSFAEMAVDVQKNPVPEVSLPGVLPGPTDTEGSKEDLDKSVESRPSALFGAKVKAISPPSIRDVKARDAAAGKPSPPKVPNFSRPVLHPRNSYDRMESNVPPLFSPRSEEFHMVGISRQQPEDAFGILSPPTTTADAAQQASASRVDDAFGMMSPGLGGGFPSDPFRRSHEPIPMDLSSPRAAEFHIASLHPTTGDDSFGLTSPRNTEFSINPIEAPKSFFNLDQLKQEPHTVLPQHVHPILPPSTEAAPRPSVEYPFPNINDTMDMSIPSQSHDSFDSSSSTPTPKATRPPAMVEVMEPKMPKDPGPSNEMANFRFPPLPAEPKQKSFLDAPPQKRKLRSRFSTPNLSQQIKIHKLQTAMEAQLANRNSQAQDDLDALMSPRATEMTRNPFHFDLDAARGKISHGSKGTPSIIGFDVPTLPQTTKEDPRSPAQKGGSPIVRNIWDVL